MYLGAFPFRVLWVMRRIFLVDSLFNRRATLRSGGAVSNSILVGRGRGHKTPFPTNSL